MRRTALLLASSLAATAAWAATIDLDPPQPSYPILLDHSCGGVNTSTFALGFDAQGHVVGAVHAWTRCPHGGGRHQQTVTYSSWHRLVWALDGTLLEATVSEPMDADPSFTASDAHGNTISTRRAPSATSVPTFAAVLTTP